jgi:putative pyruvate formate lyase activating enzyme
VFIGHCSLHCIFCQNHEISQDHEAAKQYEAGPTSVASVMLRLQAAECHNLNLVTPTHSVNGIVRALASARANGFDLPVVYNSHGYESVEVLRLLEGIVDIYLPDLKYADDSTAESLTAAPGYVARSRAAVAEMHRQVGNLELGPDGIARRGLLIRHLVLPSQLAGTLETLRWLACRLGTSVWIHLMAQYAPAHQAHGDPRLAKPLSRGDYDIAVSHARRMGFHNLITS